MQLLPFDLLQLGHTWEQFVTTLLICSLRMLIAFMVLPAMSDEVLTGANRAAVASIFGAFVAWGQPPDLAEHLRAGGLALYAIKEGMLGLVLGFAASPVFWIAQSVGAYVDDLAGYNNVQVSNPLRGEQSTPVSNLLGQLVVAVFWTLGGMTFLLGAIFESYKIWPIADTLPSMSNFAESFVIQQTDTLMQMTTKLAMPMLLVLVLIDLSLGLIAKAADKLEPSTLSQPIKGAVTLLLLALFVSIFIDQVKEQVSLRALSMELHAIWAVH
ncbi:type III secretion system export apparatus subunit SctT [Paraburkholderia sp. CI3]|uniref:type III secretion system export apparatus subunit SctT n=1 Tax=Paraburkholderia sp. CI3 TaxID=2991060 RepID=UPI003D1FDC77